VVWTAEQAAMLSFLLRKKKREVVGNKKKGALVPDSCFALYCILILT